MKRKDHFQETANAGGGTTPVPFHGVVAPSLYAGEAVLAALSGVIASVKRTIEVIRRRHWEKKTSMALSALDDAILRDIGVAREDIPRVARHAAENPSFDPARRFPWAA